MSLPSLPSGHRPLMTCGVGGPLCASNCSILVRLAPREQSSIVRWVRYDAELLPESGPWPTGGHTRAMQSELARRLQLHALQLQA